MAELPLNFEAFGTAVLPGNKSNDHTTNFANMIGSVLGIVMTVALLILLFMLVSGALQWMTSGGDSGKIAEARGRITNAILGILILSASLAVFLFVQWILGVEVITFL